MTSPVFTASAEESQPPWHSLKMVVLGPATTFSDTRAIAAARSLARANAE